MPKNKQCVCHVDVDRRKTHRVTSLSSINLRYGPHVPCYAAFDIKPTVSTRTSTVHSLELHILLTRLDMDTKVSLSEIEIEVKACSFLFVVGKIKVNQSLLRSIKIKKKCFKMLLGVFSFNILRVLYRLDLCEKNIIYIVRYLIDLPCGNLFFVII